MIKLQRNVKLAQASGQLEGMLGALEHIFNYYDIKHKDEIITKISSIILHSVKLINETAHTQEELQEEAKGK